MDKTTKAFIEKAIQQLDKVTYKYGTVPVGVIAKVEQIIGELEYLIEDGEIKARSKRPEPIELIDRHGKIIR